MDGKDEWQACGRQAVVPLAAAAAAALAPAAAGVPWSPPLLLLLLLLPSMPPPFPPSLSMMFTVKVDGEANPFVWEHRGGHRLGQRLVAGEGRLHAAVHRGLRPGHLDGM